MYKHTCKTFFGISPKRHTSSLILPKLQVQKKPHISIVKVKSINVELELKREWSSTFSLILQILSKILKVTLTSKSHPKSLHVVATNLPTITF